MALESRAVGSGVIRTGDLFFFSAFSFSSDILESFPFFFFDGAGDVEGAVEGVGVFAGDRLSSFRAWSVFGSKDLRFEVGMILSELDTRALAIIAMELG